MYPGLESSKRSFATHRDKQKEIDPSGATLVSLVSVLNFTKFDIAAAGLPWCARYLLVLKTTHGTERPLCTTGIPRQTLRTAAVPTIQIISITEPTIFYVFTSPRCFYSHASSSSPETALFLLVLLMFFERN